LSSDLSACLSLNKIKFYMTVSDLVAIIYHVLPEPHAGLLSGILFGIKVAINKELYEALITTGTLHVVALSGQNISILISFVGILLLKIVSRPIANIVSIGIIIGFILFVGPTASVVRAGVMGCITLVGISFGRQIWPIGVWMLAVMGMILLHPLWAVDLSFQLSALATLGLLLFGNRSSGLSHQPILQDSDINSSKFLVSVLRDWLMIDLRITLAAQVFTIPLIMFVFQRVSFVSPLTNLLIGWLVAPIMVCGFVLVGVGLVWMPLAQLMGWIVWVPLSAMLYLIELTARIPFGSIHL
jgi:competence protein ComEC